MSSSAVGCPSGQGDRSPVGTGHGHGAGRARYAWARHRADDRAVPPHVLVPNLLMVLAVLDVLIMPNVRTRGGAGAGARRESAEAARDAAHRGEVTVRWPRRCGGQIASSPRSPVRTRMTESTGTTQTLPSPILPV